MVINVMDLIEVGVLVAAAGGFIYRVKAIELKANKLEEAHTKLTDSIIASEQRQLERIQVIELRFIGAVEKFAEKLSTAIEGLRDIMSDHRTRIVVLEKLQDLDEDNK